MGRTLFKNRAWRKIRGHELEEVTGWNKLHNGLYCLYSHRIVLSNQLKENEMGRACGTCGRERYRVWGENWGKRTAGNILRVACDRDRLIV
jgi:hypothetical protein